MNNYTPESLILSTLVGGLLGMVGQGIRVVVGSVKKSMDKQGPLYNLTFDKVN